MNKYQNNQLDMVVRDYHWGGGKRESKRLLFFLTNFPEVLNSLSLYIYIFF